MRRTGLGTWCMAVVLVGCGSFAGVEGVDGGPGVDAGIAADAGVESDGGADAGTVTGNRPPSANAGFDFEVTAGSPANLDGRRSSDPDGDPLTFDWTLTSVPEGSPGYLESPTSATPRLYTGLPGEYVATLVVSDGELLSAADTVTIRARSSGYSHNYPPVARIAPPSPARVGDVATLDGSGSYDYDDDLLAYEWTLTSAPADSTAALTGQRETATFTPDVEGDYEVQLVVSDGLLASEPVSATVAVSPRGNIEPLAFAVLDAEYSDALDVMVLVSAGPNRLHVYDPAAKTLSSVDLPLTPTSVSVSPSGTHAAVGHDAWISYVELGAPALVDTVAIDINCHDVVLSDEAYVYAFTKDGAFEDITALDLTTGAITRSTGSYVRTGALGKLHPDGQKLYAAYGSDVDRYSIDGGSLVFAQQWPYFADYDTRGGLWISDDGTRLFTGGADTFRSSDDPAQDMTYAGRLENAGSVIHLDHGGPVGLVAAIMVPPYTWENPLPPGREVWLFGDRFLARERTIRLPTFETDGGLVDALGRFVFFSADQSRLWVLVETDPQSEVPGTWGVVEVGI